MSRDSRPYYPETYTIFVEPIRDPAPYARTFNIDRTNRPLSKSAFSAFAYGLGAGLVGITATSISQTIEQHITGRPAACVPGESILRYLKRSFGHQDLFHRESSPQRSEPKGSDKEKGKECMPEEEGSEPSNLTEPPSEGGELTEPTTSANAAARWAAYLGQGAFLGGIRGVLSYYGARGFLSDLVILGFTSSVEGCPFWAEIAGNASLSQSLLDSMPDLVHQAVYAFVTGFFCDHWVN
ncbi:hypothetical protein AN958_04363 [Leucoagaricus sp. SymC.cos]|nr:hypothetical protein AN958_04363 [Leucoagaricus sp. SymC.cos]